MAWKYYEETLTRLFMLSRHFLFKEDIKDPDMLWRIERLSSIETPLAGEGEEGLDYFQARGWLHEEIERAQDDKKLWTPLLSAFTVEGRFTSFAEHEDITFSQELAEFQAPLREWLKEGDYSQQELSKLWREYPGTDFRNLILEHAPEINQWIEVQVLQTPHMYYSAIQRESNSKDFDRLLFLGAMTHMEAERMGQATASLIMASLAKHARVTIDQELVKRIFVWVKGGSSLGEGSLKGAAKIIFKNALEVEPETFWDIIKAYPNDIEITRKFVGHPDAGVKLWTRLAAEGGHYAHVLLETNRALKHKAVRDNLLPYLDWYEKVELIPHMKQKEFENLCETSKGRSLGDLVYFLNSSQLPERLKIPEWVPLEGMRHERRSVRVDSIELLHKQQIEGREQATKEVGGEKRVR